MSNGEPVRVTRDTTQVSSALEAGHWTPDGPKLPLNICPQCPHPTSALALAGSHLTRHCALHSLLRKCHLIPDSSSEAFLPHWPLGQLLSGISWHMQGVVPHPPHTGCCLSHLTQGPLEAAIPCPTDRLSRRKAGLFRPAQPTGTVAGQ